MNPFDYNQSPTEAMLAQMAKIRQCAKALADAILEVPNSRERSLAMTNLEQATMWANKAATHAPEGVKP